MANGKLPGARPPLDIPAINRSMDFYPAQSMTISCGTVTVDTARKMVLLIHNREHNIMQLPKGRKNIGEDMLAAALRETYEETGMVAQPLALKFPTRATPANVHDHAAAAAVVAAAAAVGDVVLGLTEVVEHQEPSPPGSADAAEANSPGAHHLHDHHLPDGHLGNHDEDSDGVVVDDDHVVDDPSASPPPAHRYAKKTTNPEVTDSVMHNEFVGVATYPDPQSSMPSDKLVFFFAATADSTVKPACGTQEAWERLEARWYPAADAPDALTFRAEADAVRKAVADLRRNGYAI